MGFLRAFLFVISFCIAACEQGALNPSNTELVEFDSASAALPGGEGSTAFLPFPSYDKPFANLPENARADFYAGKALAEQPWIKAPTTTTARDGLGPIYNARTCLSCHIRGGRGRMPDSGGELRQGIVRLSLSPQASEQHANSLSLLGVIPEPTYGDQLQTQSVSLAHQLRQKAAKTEFSKTDVPPEAYVKIVWHERNFSYPDGATANLRKPLIELTNQGYGELHQDTRFSLRNAPPIHGMGLLERIPQSSIDSIADPQDNNRDGISGRVNQVWDVEAKQTRPGRFGLKANRPSLAMAVAGAFANDVGISNPLFSESPCTPKQTRCLQQANGNDAEGVELPAHLLELVVNFNRNLGVPSARESSENGRRAFTHVGCVNCHQPSFTTSLDPQRPHLSQQIIWPYSDLLLHDMSEELADNRTDFTANGSEWRTPPLWGLGLSAKVNGSMHLLHDGRARSVEEAILWHSGEGENAKQLFTALPEETRLALIQFVESL